MPAPTREDTQLLTLSMDDIGFLGTFDKKDGGEFDSDDNKYKPGGMAAEISLGGTISIGNLTFTRYYDWARDAGFFSRLPALVGNGRASAGVQMLDLKGNPRGPLMTYSGTLKTFTPPDLDSTSNDAALWSLEFTCDGIAFS